MRRVIRRSWLVATMAAVALCVAALAQADTQRAQRELHHQLVRYYHADGYIKSIGRVAYRTQYSPRPRIARRWTKALRWLEWMRRDAARAIELLRHPASAVPASGIAHWRLWTCITNGAYPGAAHEGDGYDGLYSGPLGMTTPWMGHYPTGSDWVHTPIAVVYSFAEIEYRITGYSHDWLRHQWPNTSPPCMGFA